MAAADIAETSAGGTYLKTAAGAVTTGQKANVTAKANYDDEQVNWVTTMASVMASLYTGSISYASYQTQLLAASVTRTTAIQE